MGKVAVISKSLGALGRHPILSFAGGLSFLFCVDKWLGLFDLWPRLDTIMTDLAGKDWLSHAVNSPWFGILSLLIGLICFVRIGVLAQREERQQAENLLVARQDVEKNLLEARQDVEKRISDLISDRTRLPTLQAKRQIIVEQSERLGLAAIMAGNACERYSAIFTRAQSSDLDNMREIAITAELGEAIRQFQQALGAVAATPQFGSSSPPPTIEHLGLQDAQPKIALEGSQIAPTRHFRIPENSAFIAALSANVIILQREAAKILKAAEDRRADVVAAEQDVRTEIERLAK